MQLKNSLKFYLLPIIFLSVSHTALADEYTQLFKDKKYAEIEKLANSKLAVEPNHPSALNAKVNLIINQDLESKIEDGIKLAERCIAANAKSSICHEAQGNILGTKALKGSMFSAATIAGKIRDSFKTAVNLDPKNISARSSLMQFYLQAPSFMGGGADKAQELIVDTIKVMPTVGALLQARLDMQQDNITRAESGALAVNLNANEDDDTVNLQKNLLMGIGQTHVKAKKYTQAQKIFVEIGKRFPTYYGGMYGLGRSFQEQGNYNEAITHFEKSLTIEATAYTHYRIAQALQNLKENTKAVTAYEKALSFAPSLNKKEKSDALEQIKKLKS